MSPSLPRAPRDKRRFRARGLREAIQAAGFQQVDLARDLDVSKGNINDLVNGRAHTRIERAERIATFLGRPVSELFEPVGP